MGGSPTSTALKPNHRLQLSSVPWERVASRPPCKKVPQAAFGQISPSKQQRSTDLDFRRAHNPAERYSSQLLSLLWFIAICWLCW